jgi:hypothetical protein
MISNPDIYRAAHMLIERHGAEALAEAAKMLDKMLDDSEGYAVWLRIRQAIADLQARPKGPVH